MNQLFQRLTFNYHEMDPFTSVIAIFVLALLFYFCYSIISGRHKKNGELALKKNPSQLSEKDLGHFFKVIEVDEKMHIVNLAADPSVEDPFGFERLWYTDENIAPELRSEGKVIKVELDANGIISCCKCPVF